VFDTNVFEDIPKESIILIGEYMGELKQINLNTK